MLLKNTKTGNILDVSNEKAIALMKKQPAYYQPYKTNKSKNTDKPDNSGVNVQETPSDKNNKD